MLSVFASATRTLVLLFGILQFLPTLAHSREVSEVIVTARKQAEKLQEVPISITAFSSQQLKDMGVNNNEELTYMTVNFINVAQLGRRLDRPVIRGMAGPSTFGEPNASYFIDGAYVSGSISTLTLGPIERVEILRGPQSTQFGRATFSGAVNYITRKPDNEFNGELLARGASHESATLSGWASGPLVNDKILYFVSGSVDHSGGEWRNNLRPNTAGQAGSFVDPPQQGDTSDIGGTRTNQVEGKLLWNLANGGELTFKAGYIKGDDDHYPQLIVEPSELNCFVPGLDLQPGDPGYDSSAGAFCGTLKSEGREIRLNLPDLRTGMTSTLASNPPGGLTAADFMSQGEDVGTQRDQYNTLISYAQDLGEWGLTARAAYNTSELKTAFDLDQDETRALLGLFHFFQKQDREDTSFEVRLASPADDPVRGSLGAYYYNFEQTNWQHGNVGLGQGQLSKPTVAKTENLAVFGALEFDITSSLNLALEGRVARDTKSIESPIFCKDSDSPYFDLMTPVSDKVDKNSFTPRVTLRYFPFEDAMLYAQVAKGNKPGNYNTGYFNDGTDGCATQKQLNDPDGVAYVNEEKAWNYEIGAKSSWLDKRLVANLALFYIDWENQTIFETRNIPRDFLFVPTSLGINAGKSRVYGLELETTLHISDKLVGTFAYGLANGELREFFSGSLENSTGNGDAAGNKMPNSPRNNIVTSLAYADIINSQWSWFARTDYSYESERYSSATNFTKVGARRRWNARTGFESDAWKISAFVNNILDEQTPSAILGFPRLIERNESDLPPQGYALTPTPGRSAGVEVIRRFGQ